MVEKSQKIKLLIELLEDDLLERNELLISKESSLKIKEISAMSEQLDRRDFLKTGVTFAGAALLGGSV